MPKNLHHQDMKRLCLLGEYQRVSSYDPNMCTTAAHFSPFYRKNTVTQNESVNRRVYKNLGYEIPNNTIESSTALRHTDSLSKTEDSSLLSYNPNDLLSVSQRSVGDPFTGTECQNSAQNTSLLCDNVDYIQRIDQGIEIVSSEAITNEMVLQRLPAGRIYQEFYITNDEKKSMNVVDVAAMDHCQAIQSDIYSMQPYEFPSACNIENIDTQEINSVVDDDNQREILATQILEEEQQRILLESTMSPLLAAVNDVTQRDAEFLSYLNQHVDKEQCADERRFYKGDERMEPPSSNGNSSDESDDYICVSDKYVESRARATLPTHYLYFGSTSCDNADPTVFAKKPIPVRTKFGPVEGEVRLTSDIFLNVVRSQYPRQYPLFLVGKSRVLIVTNENTSNWMRFVRLAQTFSEQNLHIVEENSQIYFKCCRYIYPKEELRVGYHNTYATKYNLPILEASVDDMKKKYELDNPWMCFECDQRFPTSQDIQKHIEVHNVEDASCRIFKRKTKRKKKQVKKAKNSCNDSSRCSKCFKVFMTSAGLNKHLCPKLVGLKSKIKAVNQLTLRKTHRCLTCDKRYSSKKRLKIHQQTHIGVDTKPYKCSQCDQLCRTPAALAAHVRSHSTRLYSCVYCQTTFHYALEFKKHVAEHKIGCTYKCLHCSKSYKEYHLVRKHIRSFHPAVKYPCNECGRLFINMTCLRRHKARHASKESFECIDCNQKYAAKKDLQHHIKVSHKIKRKTKKETKKESLSTNHDASQYFILSPKKRKKNNPARNNTNNSVDYLRFQFKCEDCKLGFKRRGMFINHISRSHPEKNIDSIDELNQPIIKMETIFNCPYCPKMYKNNAKRKFHILNHHPGKNIPPSFRRNSDPKDANIQTLGCIKSEVQKCQFCYKQYSSRTRLIAHCRKAHVNENPLVAPSRIKGERVGAVDVCSDLGATPLPVSPENKLLKLSSAALELSSIEDRKFFDFLNEKAVNSNVDESHKSNYKIAKSEFSVLPISTSAHTVMNSLPQLFEGSMDCE